MPNQPVQNEILLEYLKIFSIFPELSHIQIFWHVVDRDYQVAEMGLFPYTFEGELSPFRCFDKNHSILQRVKHNDYGNYITWKELIANPCIRSFRFLTELESLNVYFMLVEFSSEYVDITRNHSHESKNISHIVRVATPNIEKAILDLEKQYA